MTTAHLTYREAFLILDKQGFYDRAFRGTLRTYNLFDSVKISSSKINVEL